VASYDVANNICQAVSSGDPMQSEEGRRSRIAHFLDMGVPIDFEDPDGVTALLAAAVSGFANTVDLLLMRAATIDKESTKVAPARCRSPRRRISFTSRNEGSKCVG